MTEAELRHAVHGFHWEAVADLAEKAPAWLIPLLMLTTPLEFTETWFPNQIFQVGRFVMVAAILAFFVTAAANRRFDLPALGLWLPPMVFMLYAGASAAVSHSSAGIKTAGAMVSYGLLALALFSWTRDAARQASTWKWFAISCIGLSLITILQRIFDFYIWNAPTSGGLERFNATFADPNVLARVLTVMVVSGVALLSVITRPRERMILIAAITVSAAALPLTYSRQAWVIGGVTLALAVVISQRRRDAIAMAAAALVVFGAVTLLVPQVQSRFGVLQQNLTGPPTHIFERPGLAFLNYLPLDSERHYLIAAGLQMFYDHPILGVGYGAFQREILGPYRGFIISGYTTTESHTSVVTILAELGTVGLLLALWWMVEYFRQSIVAAHRDAVHRAYIVAPMLAVIVILLESQLNARLVDEPYLWIFLGMASAAIALGAPETRTAHSTATTRTAATSQNSTARSFFQ